MNHEVDFGSELRCVTLGSELRLLLLSYSHPMYPACPEEVLKGKQGVDGLGQWRLQAIIVLEQ